LLYLHGGLCPEPQFTNDYASNERQPTNGDSRQVHALLGRLLTNLIPNYE
jgi:hypothetical protein